MNNDKCPPTNVGSNGGLGLAPERAAFEAWASKEGWACSDIDDKCAEGAPRSGEYRHQGLQDAWEVWQAAAAAERERCASICDGIGAGYTGAARRLDGRHATHAAGQRDGANECAAEIRKA